MPNYWPLSSGNWSSLSNWVTANTVPFNASILPTPTDDVFSNNRIIYIDGNYQVNSIRNISATNIAQGGHFVLNDGFTLSAFVYGGGVTNVACLQFLSAAPASGTLVGNLCAGDPSATVLRPKAFENVSSGNFTIIGNSLGGFNNGSNADITNSDNGIIENAAGGNLTLIGSFSGDRRSPSGNGIGLIGIRNQSTGNIFLTGSVFGGNGLFSHGLYNAGGGSVFIQGSVFSPFGGWPGSNIDTIGLVNASNGSVFIDGLIRGGGTSIANNERCVGVSNESTGTINVSGRIIGGFTNSSHGIINRSTGTVNITGVVIAGATGDTCVGVFNSSTGIINLSGSATGGGAPQTAALRNNAGGTINVIGVVTGGTGGFLSTGLRNEGSGRVTLVGTAIAGPGNGAHGIVNQSTGSVFVTGNCFGANGVNAYGISNVNIGTVDIIGDLRAGTAGSGQAFGGVNSSGGIMRIVGNIIASSAAFDSDGLRNQSTGTIFLTGNVFGGSGGAGIVNSSTGTILMSGNVFGGSGSSAFGISNSGTGFVTISGNSFGGTAASGISNTGTNSRVSLRRAISNDFGVGSTGIVVAAYGVVGASNNTTIVEEIQSGARGVFPTNGNVFLRRTTNTLAIYRTNTGQSVTMFTSLSGTNLNPIPRDVRQGVFYDFGALVGTLAMPIPAVVNAGVPVDNTVGTGVFTPIGVWSFPVSAIASTTSMGGRVKNSATIDSIGALIKNLT